MLPELCREVCPEFELGHLSTEDHLPEFLPEPPQFNQLRFGGYFGGWPDRVLGRIVDLLLARVRLALLDGRTAEAEALLNSAERASADADSRFEPSAGRASSLLVNVPAAVTLLRVYLAELRGDAETTVDLVPRAMAARREGEVMLGTIIGWYAGMAEWLRGRPAEADRLLSPAGRPPFGAVYGTAVW
jgi:ATP/maltotriose-dependent transcriptional regulator MalT